MLGGGLVYLDRCLGRKKTFSTLERGQDCCGPVNTVKRKVGEQKRQALRQVEVVQQDHQKKKEKYAQRGGRTGP